jgi:2,4-dienoyl-CoA reductase-like NADH-dependent reductase (Old Yellow Enzyme family)/thioredoxin reductase
MRSTEAFESARRFEGGVTLQRLFEPIRIGGVELRNRIVMLPMETSYGSEEGFVTERIKAYYDARARDVGLVLIQITCVESQYGKGYVHQLSIDDDKYIPGLRELAQAIQSRGAKAFIQLHHAGALARGDSIVAASPIPVMPGRPTPRSLSLVEIKDLIEQYALAAERARKAVFDGVEVVASGNYLVWNFLSPSWNQRQDEYGKGLEGRAKLLLDIVRAIKSNVGSDFPVTCRLAVKEYDAPNGMTVSETQRVARRAVDAGLDGITVTAIGGDSVAPSVPGALIPLARAMKKAVSIPVTAAARMDLESGERAIEEGYADLVGIGRRLLADPEYVAKAASGRLEEVTPCIACKTCIDSSLLKNEPLRCAVNPQCGHEAEYRLTRADAPKKVVVVGGGPGGLKAAVTAASRGHKVILFEKSDALGGQLIPGALPPGRSLLRSLIDHLSAQTAKLGVHVRLGHEADGGQIEALHPDAVVLATGRKDVVPEIPGLEKANVVKAIDVLLGKVLVGIDVAVIGGGLVGCETAEFLADKGMNVTIVEVLERLMAEASPVQSARLLKRLAQKKVTPLLGTKEEVFKDNVLTVTTEQDKMIAVPVDTVVIATGAVPNRALYDELKDTFEQIYRLGDCVELRDIASAIKEGFEVGLSI